MKSVIYQYIRPKTDLQMDVLLFTVVIGRFKFKVHH